MALRLTTKLVLFFILFASPVLANRVILKADHLFFDETVNTVLAKGHVSLQSDELSVSGDSLEFSIDTGMVISTTNVTITKGDESFNSSSLVLNLNDFELQLSDIHIAIQLPDTDRQMYVKISNLLDKSNIKIAKNARITTCDLSDPHHYLQAWKMVYRPGKRVDLIMAYWVNNFTFFPFTVLPPVPILEIFPVPYYSYHLGERQVIWNFPTIGNKNTEGWGWFVQNKIDFRYKNNKESSVLLDWFETTGTRKGNIGAGVDLNYGDDKNYGAFYFYNYDFSYGLEKKSNAIVALSQTVEFDKWQFSGQFKRLKVDERINSTGSDNYRDLGFSMIHDKNNFPLKFSVFDKQQFKQQMNKTDVSISKEALHYRSSFSLNDANFEASKTRRLESSLSHAYDLKHGITVSHAFDYFQNDRFDDSEKADENLKTTSTLESMLPHDIRLKVRLDYFVDLDQDRVTSDSQSQNFLYRLPELELSKQAEFLSVKSSSIFRFGVYKEYRYSSSSGQLEIVDLEADLLQPNVYFFSQKLGKEIQNLPVNSVFKVSSIYEQYIFKNDGVSLFEGDALYTLGLDSTLTSELNNWVKLRSEYRGSFVPDDNNSPFYSFNKNTSQANELTESLVFYYNRKKSEKNRHDFYLEWSNAAGYNWLIDAKPWQDYKTAVTVKLNDHKAKISTAQKLNGLSSPYDRYSPLLVEFDSRTKKQLQLNYVISYDLNDIVQDQLWTVNYSTIRFAFPLGKHPEYQWNFNIYLNYQSDGLGKPFNASYYDIQTFSVRKYEHFRIFEMGYTKQSAELFFKYTFTAFPKDPIVIRRSRNAWTVEGRLKGSSEERFK